MKSKKMNTSEVDDYVNTFPEETKLILNNIRDIIKENAPEAIETISYKMPAFKMNGKILVYFAAYKNHIGFYATPNTHEKFSNELMKYKQGKGSVQFPLNEPIPYHLIAKMLIYKVNENNKNQKVL